MSLDAALTIANSGLRAIDAQLAVISNNVANAGTAGYAVETQQQSSAVAGDVGEGVFTGDVVRDVNLQQQSNLLAQNGVVSYLQTTQSALQPISGTQGTVGAGNDIASQLTALQDSFTTLASDPSDVAQQSAVVDAAQTLADGINQLAASYTTARQAAQNDLVASLTTLDQALATIGDLNQKIVAEQSGGNSIANLQNLRDAAVATISNLIDVQQIQQPDGAIILITPSGLTLPTPTPADLDQAPFSTSGVTVLPTDTAPSGGIPPILLDGTDITPLLQGGQIGADITLRDTTLPTYQAGLDEFSETLANQFAGVGLQLFTAADGTIPAPDGTPVQQNYVGFSSVIGVNPAVAADPALVRDGTVAVAGSATGPAAFTPNPSGGPASFSTLIASVLNDTFGPDAQPGVAWPAVNTTGLGINGNLAGSYGAPSTLQQFATALVSGQAQDEGNVASQLTEEQAVQTTFNTQLQQSTGVNIDTEMANMLTLQNAYAANAKVLTAIQAMLTDLSNAIDPGS